jgi:hypothetical protein
MTSVLFHRIAAKIISSNNRVPDRGPDFIDDFEYEYWYLDNKQEIIRDNFNNIRWYKNEVLHREDGPAVEYANGNKQWYLNNKWIAEGKQPENWDELVEEERIRQVMED